MPAVLATVEIVEAEVVDNSVVERDLVLGAQAGTGDMGRPLTPASISGCQPATLTRPR